MLGLVLQKKSLYSVTHGTFKTVLGFLVLMGGTEILVQSIKYLGDFIRIGFGIQAVLPNNDAIAALAVQKYGFVTALIMPIGMTEKGNEYYTVSFPTVEKRIGVPVVAESFQMHWLDQVIAGAVKQGAAKLYQKKKKWFLAIPLTWEQDTSTNERTMGIDLGLRHVAVASVGTKSLFFSGSLVAYH